MTGRSEPYTKVSEFTFAFFEDTGWYVVDYDKAEALAWGNEQGCSFVDDTCDRWSSRYFCEDEGEDGCTVDLEARARCNLRSYSSDLDSHFQYFDDSTLGGRDQLADYCPYYSRSASCKDEETGTAWWYGEQVGSDSICFVGTWRFVDSQGSNRHNGCLKTHCDEQERIVVELDADNIDHEEFTCPAGGGSVDLSDVTEGFEGTIECPEAGIRCTGDPCETNDCDGHGRCDSDDGTCDCDSGFYGSDEFSCDKKLCPNQDGPDDETCSGNGECDPDTGQCDCDQGYTEEDCSREGCPEGDGDCPDGNPCECSGHGVCKDGTCSCDEDWYGDACDLKKCPTSDGTECGGDDRGQCNTDYGICECFDEVEGNETIQHYSGQACETESFGPRLRTRLNYSTDTVYQDSVLASEFNHYQFEVYTQEVPVVLDLHVVNSEDVSAGGMNNLKLYGSTEQNGQPMLMNPQLEPTAKDSEDGFFRLYFTKSDRELDLEEISLPYTVFVNVLSLQENMTYYMNLTTDGCPKGSASCPTDEPCECSGNGKCEENGKCDCEDGWKGDSCDKKECPTTDDEECGGTDRGNCNREFGICECFDEVTGPQEKKHYTGEACEVGNDGRRQRKKLNYFGEAIDGNLSNIGTVHIDTVDPLNIHYYEFEVESTEIPIDLELQVLGPGDVSTAGKEGIKMFASFEEDEIPLLDDHQFDVTTRGAENGILRIRFESSNMEEGDFSSTGTMLVNVVSVEESVKYQLNLTRDGCALLTCLHGAECHSSQCQCLRAEDPVREERNYGYSGSECQTADCPGRPDCGGRKGTCVSPPEESSDLPECECLKTDEFEYEGAACQIFIGSTDTFFAGIDEETDAARDVQVRKSTDRLRNRYAGVTATSDSIAKSTTDSDDMVTRKTISFSSRRHLPVSQGHEPFVLYPASIRERYNLTGPLGVHIRVDARSSPEADPMLLGNVEVPPTLKEHDHFDTNSWTEEGGTHELSVTLTDREYYIGVMNGRYGRSLLNYTIDVEVSNGCPPSLNNCSFNGECDVDNKRCSCDSDWSGIKCDIRVTELKPGDKVTTDVISRGEWKYFVMPLDSDTSEIEITMIDVSPSRRAQPVVTAAFDRSRRASSLTRLRKADAFYDYDGYTLAARGSARRSSSTEADGTEVEDDVSENAEEGKQSLFLWRRSSSQQFLFIGVHNVHQAGARAQVELTMTTRDEGSTCTSDCDSYVCHDRGIYMGFDSQNRPCECFDGWSDTSGCASPRFRSFGSLPNAAQSMMVLCNMCQDTQDLSRGDMQLYRIPQPLQSHIGLEIRVRPPSDGLNTSIANPALLASQVLPREVTDFAFISSSNSKEESLVLSDVSATGNYFAAVFAKTSSNYTIETKRVELFERDDPTPAFGEEVGNWLVHTSAGNLTLTFVCVLAFLMVSCCCVNKLCKQRVLQSMLKAQAQQNVPETEGATPNPIVDTEEKHESKVHQTSTNRLSTDANRTAPVHISRLVDENSFKGELSQELSLYKSNKAPRNVPVYTMRSSDIPKPPE